MITKIQYKLGAMSKRFGRFPNAADVQATYAKAQKVAVSAKDKAVKFGSQAKEKLYKANEVLSKHMAKNPKKYAAGATAVAGAGIYNEYQKQKNDGTHAKIKKHLKSKGYVE
jgi:hypothetical protein